MIRRFLTTSVYFALASCSDTAPDNNIGSLAFSYVGGGQSETFSVSGSVPKTESATGNWAAGFMQVAPNQGTIAIGLRSPNDTTMDIVIVASSRTTAGNSDITQADCDSISCTGVVAIFANGYFCGASTGSVILTEVTAKRLKGTFSGAGICSDFNQDTTAFTVTGGTFDVPVMATEPGGGVRAPRELIGPLDAVRAERRRTLLPIRPR